MYCDCPFCSVRRVNPYRRNTDSELRALERMWKITQTFADFAIYRNAAIRAGIEVCNTDATMMMNL